MADAKRRPSVVDFMTKSGQLLTSIQGTLDKQFGQIAEAVHLGGNENSELFSNIPAFTSKDFEAYLGLIKEHWPEYRDICSQLLRAKDSQITTAADIGDATNAFREIPQVFFNSDYKQSGFEQHQIFTQPLRITVQNQGKVSAGLATYQRKIEQHLVKHLSNVDGLLRSLMSVAAIQSDIGIALDRARSGRDHLRKIEEGELKTGFRILQLSRRKIRIQQVLQLLDQCEQVATAKPSVDSLIRVGDFNGATELVQATRAILGSELHDVKLVESIRMFIDAHGRSIDSVIESEFSDLVCNVLFDQSSSDSKDKLKSMLFSMSVRDLLIPCLQLKLKEVLPKRLRKEMKAAGASAAYLSGSDQMFEYLHAKLEILADIILLIDSHVGIGLSPNQRQIQRLSSLRLFEAVTAAGLARCSQSITAKLNDVASETASVVSSQVGNASQESVDPFQILRIAELRSVESLVRHHVSRVEILYEKTFVKIELSDEISFLSSVLKSASQNGNSPDVSASVASVALQRLLQFQPAAQALMDSFLSEEKWDKSATISPEILKIITVLDPTPSAMFDSASDVSDSSPSSSLLTSKQLRVNRQFFLVVPSALPLIQLLNECLNLALTIPGVAVECLSRMAGLVRWVNTTARELVLEGQMTVRQKKVINATNLALASQLAGMLAQILAVMGRKFCQHYRIENSLVQGGESDELSGSGVLVDDPSAALNELLVNTVVELNEHRMDILMKLADILISRFDHHLKLWLAVSATGQGPLDGIVKDFTQMYKVLLKSLQPENLKRVFSRAFSESCNKFESKLQELVGSPTLAPVAKSELSIKVRVDLLYLYQDLLVGESMGGVRSALNDMISEMLRVTEMHLSLVDKSESAEVAVTKLRSLIAENA